MDAWEAIKQEMYLQKEICFEKVSRCWEGVTGDVYSDFPPCSLSLDVLVHVDASSCSSSLTDLKLESFVTQMSTDDAVISQLSLHFPSWIDYTIF